LSGKQADYLTLVAGINKKFQKLIDYYNFKKPPSRQIGSGNQ